MPIRWAEEVRLLELSASVSSFSSSLTLLREEKLSLHVSFSGKNTMRFTETNTPTF